MSIKLNSLDIDNEVDPDDYLDAFDYDEWDYDDGDFEQDNEILLEEWKQEIIDKLTSKTTLSEEYIRKTIEDYFEEYFWDDYSPNEVIEMFIEEEY